MTKIPAHIENPDTRGIIAMDAWAEDEPRALLVNTSCEDCHGRGLGCCLNADIPLL